MASGLAELGTVTASPRRNVGGGGYRKGEEARERIILVALGLFGDRGYAATTTRAIAADSGVTLPALQYYFGGKQGLYIACADLVAKRCAAMTRDAAIAAHGALAAQVSGTSLRAPLKQLMAAIAHAMILAPESAQWGGFVTRELLYPGPAFDIMLTRLWSRGIDLVAMLIARIEGRDRSDEASRIRAMLLISSLTAFQSGRHVARRTLDWTALDDAEFASILAAMNQTIDRIG